MTIRVALAAAAATLLSVTAVQAEPVTFTLDPTHTFVTFEAKHFGTSTNRGRFDKKSGSIVIDPVAKTGQIEISIDMASINTGTGSFDGHLKSKDFFNAEEFPTATFKSTKIKFEGDKIDEVEGTLTMLGKTVPVTLDAEHYGCYDHPRLKRQVCGGDFETTIKRSDFGMSYGLPMIPDNIKLDIQVEAVRQ
ncbi:YceI family protein [Aquabacterium sp. A3]|uniref:YceI family protein n=1 Tax=Aquabacterium sp. A3 TaxID=3132829 RepID=UPI003119F615